jgi:hypothetical protein
MWPQRVGAHAEPMFNDLTTTSILVADRHAQFRHEAHQHRLARIARTGRRAAGLVRRTSRPAALPLPAATSPDQHADPIAA